MDNDDKGLGIGSTGKNLTQAFKEGTLFSKPDTTSGGTGYAPNADNMKPVDDTDDLQKIAEGADPEAVKKAAEEREKARAYNPRDFENRRSQSMVYSQREVTEQQLADVRARNEAAMRAQQHQIAEEKAKRGAFKLGIGIFIAFLVIIAIVLVFVVLTSIRRPVAPPEPEPEEKPTALSTVDGYSCETQVCGKVTDLPDGRIVLRDTAYYIYNTQTKERTSTTIDTVDHNTITSFTWGGKIYLTLDPSSGQTALFSVDENRYVTRYDYDKFYIDINDSVYDEMHQVEGEYIVAKSGSNLKLIELTSGMQVISGHNRVFIHDGYFFSYQEDGRIYAYTSGGELIKVLDPSEGSVFYTREGRLLSFEGEYATLRFFCHSTMDCPGDDAIALEVYRDGPPDYLGYVSKNSKFYRIPTN